MSTYTEFFLNSRADVVRLELIELSHSDLTQTYYVVRNAVNGITVTLETDEEQEFEYYPLKITPLGNSDDLDQYIRIDFGDLGEVLPAELDSIQAAGGFGEKPIIKYREYSSSDLTTPLFGPVTLEITNINFEREGASFEARAPALNINTTGEHYKLARFPMLRGFV